MRGSKVMSAEEAVRWVSSGKVLAVGGAGGVQEPDLLISALVSRYRSEGEPCGITEFHPIRCGEVLGRGTSQFGEPGLVSRMIGGSFWPVGETQLVTRIIRNEIEAYNLPIGVMYAMLEAAAARRPGVLTTVGLGTFMDPLQQGGALNAVSRERYVRRIEIDGETCLFYRSIPIDVSFIRASVADEQGNLSMHAEPADCGSLLLAQAARANGGKVIAQVKSLVPAGSLHPRNIRVPGMLVDAVVVHPEQMQTTHVAFDPTLVGDARFDYAEVPPVTDPAIRQMLARALAEARPGDVAALGFGVPGYLPALALACGRFDELVFTIEHGLVGGMNGYAAGGRTFPVAHNPEAIVDAADQLRLYAGGGVDIAYLGIGEVDSVGNVNVSRFGERIPGSGGFIEITQGVRRIVFCTVLGERGHRKFVPKVQQITFSAEQAMQRGQEVLYVTERAVFRLTRDGLTLQELAPDVDLQGDILSCLGARVHLPQEARRPWASGESKQRESED